MWSEIERIRIAMIITDKRENDIVQFCDLELGDAFIYENDLHIKVSHGIGEENEGVAFNLERNEMIDIPHFDEKVESVSIEIVIHEKGWGLHGKN